MNAGVYPRVCGGTHADAECKDECRGLSPRVRGNHYGSQRTAVVAGSIPACAGEPAGDGRGQWASEVYPRVCGGTTSLDISRQALCGLSRVCGGTAARRRICCLLSGLSPRVRGNPLTPAQYRCLVGVYPRVCGGTAFPPGCPLSSCGLSPRVRGNPYAWAHLGGRWRSIPACAGEPLTAFLRLKPPEVYPRVCGGTVHWHIRAAYVNGLSPRVRGNPRHAGRLEQVAGSIPACAGEPICSVRIVRSGQVYPRVCGGTTAATAYRPVRKGLSPRVRGNPPGIPGSSPDRQVYPRVCGGTAVDRRRPLPESGLSPRVRGNRPRRPCSRP